MVEIDAPTQWLLEGPPWVAYRARLDLLGQAEDHPQVVAARRSMLADHQVMALVAELAGWPGAVLSSHKSAGHPLHKIVFLADLGLKADDPGMGAVIDRILEHRSAEGPFQVLMNVPRHFGGSGLDEWAWALCDAPLLALWRESAERYPYLFYMGTDFRKLKAPLIWYDILHVVDVLAGFPWLQNDPRLLEMIEVVWSRADPTRRSCAQGRFTAESVWSAWKDWEFPQNVSRRVG